MGQILKGSLNPWSSQILHIYNNFKKDQFKIYCFWILNLWELSHWLISTGHVYDSHFELCTTWARIAKHKEGRFCQRSKKLQFQSYDSSSYCTVLGENGYTDSLLRNARFKWLLDFCMLRSNLHQKSTAHCAKCMDPTLWSDDGVTCEQFTESWTNVHYKDYIGRLSLVTPELMKSVQQAVLHNWRLTISEISGQFHQMSYSLLHKIESCSWWKTISEQPFTLSAVQ